MRTRLAAPAHPGGSARPRLRVSRWPDSAGLASSRAGGRASAVEQAGQHYADCSVRPVEPDGHEVLAEERALQGQDGAMTLTGCYASLRPRYQRRSEASDFPSLEWKRAFYSDYRRLVIQNHFHKCTKSCFKRTLASANSQFFFECFFSRCDTAAVASSHVSSRSQTACFVMGVCSGN